MLNFPNTLESGSPLHPHFTEGETEALKDEIISPRSGIRSRATWLQSIF